MAKLKKSKETHIIKPTVKVESEVYENSDQKEMREYLESQK